MSDDKDFEDWWDTIKDEWRGHKLELEFAYLAGKRKGEEERDELAKVVLHLSQGHCEPRRLTKAIELAKRLTEKGE